MSIPVPFAPQLLLQHARQRVALILLCRRGKPKAEYIRMFLENMDRLRWFNHFLIFK